MKLILFEDTPERANALISAITRHIGASDTVVRFEGDIGNGKPADDRTYEARLQEALASDKYQSASLIVADRDLSRTGAYTGLSEPTVKRVADQLAIPECWYTRTVDEEGFARIAERRESCIAVSSAQSEDKFARQVIAVADGFKKIEDMLVREHNTSHKASPGKTLAGVLGKPEYADKIALYASGDQNRLSAVLEMREGNAVEKRRRLTCLLGYWLWDSVLRYPGVIVNEVAASSYLNIDVSIFRGDTEIKALFEPARYSGPFAGALGAMWWRGMLDDIVGDADCPNGNEFAAKRLARSIAPSKCCEDASQLAGYYCMLSDRPVSLKNSRPGLPWFPRGADLARVSNTQYDELAPWL